MFNDNTKYESEQECNKKVYCTKEMFFQACLKQYFISV